MAEIELGAPQRQCLKQRIPDRASMALAAWADRYNMAAGSAIDWRFTTPSARTKLRRRLYPALEN